jgi:PIN domain nuclease of toxin-antitoxin system
MTKIMTYKIIDACVIISFLKKEPGYINCEEVLISSINNPGEYLMSSVTFSEICKYFYLFLPNKAVEIIESIQNDFAIRFIDVDKNQGNQAAFYKSLGGIAFLDGFVLALAKKKNATILTLDKEFLKFKEEFDIEML